MLVLQQMNDTKLGAPDFASLCRSKQSCFARTNEKLGLSLEKASAETGCLTIRYASEVCALRTPPC